LKLGVTHQLLIYYDNIIFRWKYKHHKQTTAVSIAVSYEDYVELNAVKAKDMSMSCEQKHDTTTT
jgi:hypothetical protein